MKSIKPGRGPSFMGGIVGIAACLFGVFWTILACTMGAWFMAPFGIIFIGVSVANTLYNFKNASGKNRYSAYDIVDHTEEPDPLNQRFGEVQNTPAAKAASAEADSDPAAAAYCPWCGRKLDDGYSFCPACGKKLPTGDK